MTNVPTRKTFGQILKAKTVEGNKRYYFLLKEVETSIYKKLEETITTTTSHVVTFCLEYNETFCELKNYEFLYPDYFTTLIKKISNRESISIRVKFVHNLENPYGSCDKNCLMQFTVVPGNPNLSE
jgi:hypothetical protein